ncbi:acetyl-CoA C-acyltransferase [Wenzhouxiangella sediminis]|uniref:Acetyl-CoA C-acyltransferase n=1 Tax=Wenzhouxiangella sediminis TaxID=1792836 RepID=A0A3E1K476_9GAMM|nr:acetyl-CoA C-acyltransferase [Wenzhouxiangella sediminis]RFF28867.1 acetyl-CoA C-acyltransferase [Wenzhouxiangella sediminis]
MTDSIVIVSARRTAIGSFQGQFAPTKSPDLGAAAIKAVLADAGVDGADVSEVIMGCVLPAGVGQAPARQASLGAGLPVSAGCTTINKVCGSGMKAVMQGHDALLAGSADVVVAGGMESMTNAPYMAERGLRMGHAKFLDHMFFDGLQNPYDGQMMGQFGEQCVAKYGFTRDEQDAFSKASVERAMKAIETEAFAAEITPVTVKTRKGEIEVATDEEPAKCPVDKMTKLRPAFAKDGTITAASSSKISDGAAATVLMRESEAESRGAEPLARIVAHATHSQEPEWFTTAPVGAISKVLDKAGWKADDVDLFEINEAFAAVTMAAMTELDLPHEKVNVNGGACALGHPIGASGARILVTLIHALKARGGKRGVASLCIGGGEATAIAVELV